MTTRHAAIEIEIRRGLVASVRTRPSIGHVDYIVVDYDTDCADDEAVNKDADGDILHDR